MIKLNLKIAFLAILLCTPLFSQELSFNYLLIPEDLKANCNAIVQYHDVEVKIISQSYYTQTVRKAVTVKNELGDHHSLLRLGYDDNRKVLNVKAFIYDQFGSEVKKVKRKEFNDVSASGSSLYTDDRMLYYEYTAISYPYTVVFEYETSSNSTGFIPSWDPVPAYLTSVRSSSYKVISGSGMELRKKEFNFEGFTIEKKTDTPTNIHYTISGVNGVKYEPYSVTAEDYFPWMRVGVNNFSLAGVKGSANDWASFGKWQDENLFQGKATLSESVKAAVRNRVAHTEDPVEKAKIIYKYMQDRTHYISVQIGLGGWSPFPAQEVHELGYSDCKGLSNYTKALLDAVGVTSYFTILYGDDETYDIQSDFFSMQGNHMILNLPTEDGDIWLECTNQKIPFGFIAGFTDDRDVLVITPEGGIIKHTKVYSPEENRQLTKGVYSIDFKGGIEAELHIESTGFQYDTHMNYYEGESPLNQEKMVKEYFDHVSDLKIEKMEFNNNLEASKYEEAVTFKAENYGSYSGDQLFVVANAFNRYSSVPRRIRNRKIPVDIGRGFLDQDEVTINLPKSLKVAYIPEKVELVTDFGAYNLEFEKLDSHTYVYKRTLKMNGGTYDVENYEAYRKFRKSINKYDNSKIILIKTQL